MSDASELLAVIEFVVSVLHRQNVAYFITGSLASSIHGEFRATKDVDVVAMLERRHLAPLTEECSAEFFADLDQAITALETGTSFNLIHRGTYFKVDVFPCVTAFDREATRRAIEVVPPGGHGPLRVATKEDVLLAKLRWYRPGDEQSEVQQRDIEGLVALNRDHFDRLPLSLGRSARRGRLARSVSEFDIPRAEPLATARGLASLRLRPRLGCCCGCG